MHETGATCASISVIFGALEPSYPKDLSMKRLLPAYTLSSPLINLTFNVNAYLFVSRGMFSITESRVLLE